MLAAAPRDTFNRLMKNAIDFSGWDERKIRTLSKRPLTTVSLQGILRDMKSGKIATPKKKYGPPATPPRGVATPGAKKSPKLRLKQMVKQKGIGSTPARLAAMAKDVAGFASPRDTNHPFHKEAVRTAPRQGVPLKQVDQPTIPSSAPRAPRGASFGSGKFPTTDVGRNTIGDSSFGGGFSSFSPPPLTQNRPISAGESHLETMVKQNQLSFGTPRQKPSPQAPSSFLTPNAWGPAPGGTFSPVPPGPQTPAGGDPFATPDPTPPADPRPVRLAPKLSPIIEGAGTMDITRAGKRTRSLSITGSPGRARRLKLETPQTAAPEHTPATPDAPEPERGTPFLTPAFGGGAPPSSARKTSSYPRPSSN